MKSSQIVYKYHRIETNGNVIFFDGKGDQEKSQVEIYRMYGDVRFFEGAIQDFCIVNGYATAIVKY